MFLTCASTEVQHEKKLKTKIHMNKFIVRWRAFISSGTFFLFIWVQAASYSRGISPWVAAPRFPESLCAPKAEPQEGRGGRRITKPTCCFHPRGSSGRVIASPLLQEGESWSHRGAGDPRRSGMCFAVKATNDARQGRVWRRKRAPRVRGVTRRQACARSVPHRAGRCVKAACAALDWDALSPFAHWWHALLAKRTLRFWRTGVFCVVHKTHWRCYFMSPCFKLVWQLHC